jgi:hypothetical protein
MIHEAGAGASRCHIAPGFFVKLVYRTPSGCESCAKPVDPKISSARRHLTRSGCRQLNKQPPDGVIPYI